MNVKYARNFISVILRGRKNNLILLRFDNQHCVRQENYGWRRVCELAERSENDFQQRLLGGVFMG